jgi:hypothetical protein
MQDKDRRITGHVRVEDRTRGRVWVAAYFQADGTKTRKTLGPAWVKDSGRKTPRGAIVWRAADGPKPDQTYLTPKDAQGALVGLLTAERAKPAGTTKVRGKTFGDATDAWLAHTQGVRDVAPTTLRGYRVIVGKLHDEFPRDLPLRRIGAQRIASYQDRLLAVPADDRLDRTTIRRRMLALRRILDHALGLGWIGANPAADVAIIAEPAPDPDFNVLEPTQVEAVARAVAEVPDDELPRRRNGQVDEHALAATRSRLRASGVSFGLRQFAWPLTPDCGSESCVRSAGATSTGPGATCMSGAAPRAPHRPARR